MYCMGISKYKLAKSLTRKPRHFKEKPKEGKLDAF